MHCFFAILLMASMVVVTSAQRASCETVRCGFGTTCVDGRCVCPKKNMHFEQCGSACPARCDLGSAIVKCTADCKMGCFCDEDFVLDKPDGDCVRREQCPGKLRCGLNEEVKACGACDQTCNQDRKACSLSCRQPECGCQDGFFRDLQGRCVPESPQCRNSDQCSQVRCRPGTECKNGHCVLLDNPCQDNEEFRKCGTACEPSCDKPDVRFCTLNCVSNVCQCKNGFFRNSNGSCVKRNNCSQRRGDTKPAHP